MKAVIIGAGGFIGRALSEYLRQLGWNVHDVSSSRANGIDKVSGLLPVNFKIEEGTDVVFYLAQSPVQPLPAGATHMLSVNVLSAVRAATAACVAGTRRFIYASSGTVYAPSFTRISESHPVRRDSWYVLSKLHAEEALNLLRDVLDVSVARIFGVYGPGQLGRLVPNLVESVKRGRPIFIEGNPSDPGDRGGLRISLCHVRDACHQLAALAEHSRVPVVNLAGREVLSIRDMAGSIAHALGKKEVLNYVERTRSSDLMADTTLLDATIKVSAPIPFAQGIDETIKFFNA